MKLKEILKEYLKEEYEILIGPLGIKDFKEVIGRKEDRKRDHFFYEGFARGVMDIKGTLYIMGDSTQDIHADLVRKLNSKNIITDKYLKSWPTNAESLNEFVCVLSYNNKLWGMSGTYMLEGVPKNLYKKYSQLFSNIGYSFTPEKNE